MTVNKLQLPAKQNAVQEKINEIIDNLGGGGGSSTDVQINSTSITSGGVANIVTNTAYDASNNKIATMSDLPSGGANTDLSNLTATGEAHFLKNTATGTNSLTIGGTATSVNAAVNIGYNSSVALSAGGQATRGIAIGVGANVTGTDSIQLGMGTASSNSSLYAGFYIYGNYQLLDGTTGLIPDARISTNIARTSQIPSTSGLANTSLSNLSSTGKKVIDGQWVQSFTTLMESNGTKNGVQLSLSSYLPSDSYKYNVKFKFYCFDDDSTYYYHIETDIFNSGSTATGKDASTQIAGGTYSRQNVNIFDLPVGTGRYIKVYGSGADEINIYALGYCRIGTNS